ncbi:MAG TPA: LysE family translocator [Gammaproteobacteria bacterium]|jgi:threonine/homoserine/homoserine lactone efflux protein|nr:LysE family translocator [Gammaproteobacteria bacterium]
MTQYAHLWIFFVFVLGIMVLPGLDMAYILGSALAGGRKPGLMALGGVVAGGTVHVTAGVLGISVLLKLYPAAFRFMLLAGALYIAWIGFSILKSTSAFHLHPEARRRSSWATFRQGMLTCLLNPKAYLFMLAVFPQFLRPEYGTLWIQGVVMWLMIAVTQVGVYGPLALAAGRVLTWLDGDPASAVMVSRVVGLMLMVVAVFTAVDGWRA